ncbi:hypothetical protein VT84_13575 [Gemmata sp. SH-PL17]|nr:hypothetical protein VT84_13575 [Gemmata sp. SH-PL17]
MIQVELGALVAGAVTLLTLLGGAIGWAVKFMADRLTDQLEKQRQHDLVLVERFDEIVAKLNTSFTALHSRLDDVRHNTCRCPHKPQ